MPTISFIALVHAFKALLPVTVGWRTAAAAADARFFGMTDRTAATDFHKYL